MSTGVDTKRAGAVARGLAALAAVGVLLAACSGPAPTPTPSPTVEPTATAVPAPTATPEPTATPVPNVTDSVQHYAHAYALLSRGEWIDAERRFTVVIELEPNFARAWDGRGQARLNKGDVVGALADFDKAIELKPELAKAYGNRASARYFLDDAKGAEADSNRAIQLDPSDPRPYIVLGRLAADAGLIVAAAKHFDDAVRVAPDRGDVYWWRGRFLSAVEEYRLALADLNVAIELAPSLAAAYLDRARTILEAGFDPRLARPDVEEALERSKIEPKNEGVERQSSVLLDQIDDWVKRQGPDLPPLPTEEPGALVTPTPQSTSTP